MYVQDNNELMPASSTVWSNLALSSKVLTCLSQSNAAGTAYVYNNYMSSATGLTGSPMQTLTPGAVTADTVWMTADGKHAVQSLGGYYQDYAQIAYAPADVSTPHTLGNSLGTIVSFLDGHVAMSTAPGATGTLFGAANFLSNIQPLTPAQMPTVASGTFGGSTALPGAASYYGCTGANVSGPWSTSVAPGWAGTGNSGLYNLAQLAASPATVPAGLTEVNTGYLNANGSTLSQTLTQTFATGHTYVFSAYLATMNGVWGATGTVNYSMQIYDGTSSTALGTAITGAAPAGSWSAPISVSYTANSGQSGHLIEIVFTFVGIATGASGQLEIAGVTASAT